MRAPPKFKDISGQSFGHLTVVSRHGSLRNNATWLCRCACGKNRIVTTNLLRCGEITSCGCQKLSRKHGHTVSYSKSPTYSSWQSIIARCEQPSNPAYAYYKANGITICERWRSSFASFLSDMGERPSLAHSIDRHPNKMGNYDPSNCRWATRKEQANNRVTNRRVVYNGEILTLSQLIDRTGIAKELLMSRLRKGWALEEALTAPKQRGARRDLMRR